MIFNSFNKGMKGTSAVLIARVFYFLVFLSLWGTKVPAWACGEKGGGEGPTIGTFAFNSYRNGMVTSPLNPLGWKEIKQRDFPIGASASPSMPLYLNGHELKKSLFPSLEGKEILFFGTIGGEYQAYDLCQEKILWKVKLGKGAVASTPFMDSEKGEIYLLSKETVPLKKGPRDDFDEVYHFSLYTLDFSGRIKDELPLDLSAVLQREGKISFPFDPASRLHCRTALGQGKDTNGSYLFFGCSIKTNQDSQEKGKTLLYKQMRGLRGFLVKVPLRPSDKSGLVFQGDKVKVFFPSSMTKNPGTGHDTGIYNGGSTPPVLDDGSLLLATGNGPVIPEEGNFGCSVLRLDGETFSLSQKPDPRRAFFSLEDSGLSECHALNLDMTNSNPSVVKYKGGFFAAIEGKDGYLKVFDPYDLPGGPLPEENQYKVSNGNVYGGPLVFLDPNEKIRVVAPFYNPRDFDYGSLVLGDEEQGKRDPELVKLGCVGLAAKDMGPDRQKLFQFFSGRNRNDLVVDTKTSPLGGALAMKMTENILGHGRRVRSVLEGGEWGPYKIIGELGYSLGKNEKQVPPGYKLTPLWGNRLIYRKMVVAGFFNTTKEFASEVLKKKLAGLPVDWEELPSSPGFLLTSSSPHQEDFCGSYQGDGFIKLYLYQKFRQVERGWGIVSFTGDHSPFRPRKLWTYSGDPSFTPHRISPSGTHYQGNRPGVIVFSSAGEGGSSRLHFLNADTGKLLQEITYKGTPHFTMPLIVGDRVFLSTQDQGLLSFR